ncbi:D-alanyl-D-alanine carboxypeptidase, partial [hydrothermal vent metagenome]
MVVSKSSNMGLNVFTKILISVFLLASLAVFQTSTAQARPAFSAIAVDARTGKIIYANNADAKRYPASLTKIMTLYLVFEDLKAGRITMNTKLRMSRYAASRPPSKLGIRAGRTIRVRDAILALVTKSANDVATAIAENLEGSETRFARRMTTTARRIGMTRTTFRNASGLPDRRQRTTARDMA